MLITRCEIEAVDCNNWRISLVHSTDDLYTAAAVSASSSDRVSDSQWLARHIACNSAQLAANHCVIRPAELSLLPPTRQEMISTSYHRWVTGLLQLTGRTLVLYLYPLLITRGETTAPTDPAMRGARRVKRVLYRREKETVALGPTSSDHLILIHQVKQGYVNNI